MPFSVTLTMLVTLTTPALQPIIVNQGLETCSYKS